MDSHARIINVDDLPNTAKENNYDISIVIRHDLGKNVYFYHSRRFLYFFKLLQFVKFIVEHDASIITIKLEEVINKYSYLSWKIYDTTTRYLMATYNLPAAVFHLESALSQAHST